jgi:competence protein ComEA
LIGLILINDQEEAAEFVPAKAQNENAVNNVKSAATEKVGLISINRASIEDLETLPGIGAILAKRIVDYRQTNGSFKSLEQLKDVSGIGDIKFDNIKNKISL